MERLTTLLTNFRDSALFLAYVSQEKFDLFNEFISTFDREEISEVTIESITLRIQEMLNIDEDSIAVDFVKFLVYLFYVVDDEPAYQEAFLTQINDFFKITPDYLESLEEQEIFIKRLTILISKKNIFYGLSRAANEIYNHSQEHFKIESIGNKIDLHPIFGKNENQQSLLGNVITQMLILKYKMGDEEYEVSLELTSEALQLLKDQLKEIEQKTSILRNSLQKTKTRYFEF